MSCAPAHLIEVPLLSYPPVCLALNEKERTHMASQANTGASDSTRHPNKAAAMHAATIWEAANPGANTNWTVSPAIEGRNDPVSDEWSLIVHPAKTPGQLAYERDLVLLGPRYADGAPRKSWAQLPQLCKETWEGNPTDRKKTATAHVYPNFNPGELIAAGKQALIDAGQPTDFASWFALVCQLVSYHPGKREYASHWQQGRLVEEAIEYVALERAAERILPKIGDLCQEEYGKASPKILRLGKQYLLEYLAQKIQESV